MDSIKMKFFITISFSLCIMCLSSQLFIDEFYNLVKSLPVVSDKVTTHSYQEMYGNFLLPYIKESHSQNKTIKFLEIGLGCIGSELYGGSIEIWNRIFTAKDDLWSADYQGGCIENARTAGKLYNFKTLVGDQENITVLNEWMKESGGRFDIIVDDGGHVNPQIYNTVYTLWDHIKPGGLFFIEDMQVGRTGQWARGTAMVEVIKDWLDQMIIEESHTKYKHKIMPHVKAIYCQSEACVLIKCKEKDLGRCHNERVAAKAKRNGTGKNP